MIFPKNDAQKVDFDLFKLNIKLALKPQIDKN